MKHFKQIFVLLICSIVFFALSSEAEAGYIPVFRSYNRNNGDHYYTGSEAEHTSLLNSGWKDEHIAWYALDKFDSASLPVTIMYNTNTGEHIFTLSSNEIFNLSSLGWRNEGFTFKATAGRTNDTPIPVFRLYSPTATDAGRHFYTTNSSEASNLVNIGWVHEGIVFWVVKEGHDY